MTLVWVCFSGVRVVRIKSGGRFDIAAGFVLPASSGHPVYFNTTVGGGGVLIKQADTEKLT